MNGFMVEGRPADCVKLAIANIWPENFGSGSRPDLLISGMNAGANAGINVIYSGTVAAALEGAFLGVPSIAVSLLLGQSPPDWDAAARHARLAIDQVLRAAESESDLALPAHSCININIPITESDGPMPEIVVCPMNTHGLNDRFERRLNPAGDVYYWAAGSGIDFRGSEPGADVDMLTRGNITVTPLHYDLTNPEEVEPWRQRMAAALAASAD
jgi:5'-nucleotidase